MIIVIISDDHIDFITNFKYYPGCISLNTRTEAEEGPQQVKLMFGLQS